MNKRITRTSKTNNLEIFQAAENAVKTLNINCTQTFEVVAYKMTGGVVQITSNAGHDGWADATITEVAKGVFVALPNMYFEENGFEVIASDDSVWVWSFDSETFAAA